MLSVRSFSGVAMRGLVERKIANDPGAALDGRIEIHASAMEFHKGAHQRQAEARAAMPRAVGAALEPVEHLVLDVRRNAGAFVHDGKSHAVLGAPGAHRD